MLPGIPTQEWWFKPNPRKLYRNGDYKVSLPSNERIKELKNSIRNCKLYYIKLHGSYNWLDEHGQKMIIGGEKLPQIEQEPLLFCYLDIFKQVFAQSNLKLLIIGYGFGDDHINDIIANSTINGLKIHIISPKSHSEFKKQLFTKKRGKEIWDGLGGYYPYSLAQLFPSDQSDSAGWQSIQDQFFEGRIVPWP